jgi:hypothetical protein
VVGYKSQPKVRELTSSLKKLGKSVSCGQRLAIAKSALQNSSLRTHIVKVQALEIRKEIGKLSSQKHSSILRMKSKISFENFTWERVWKEICSCCPLLSIILLNCLHPQVQEKSLTVPSLCLSASVLFKLRNSHINIVQGILSFLLKSGHASKQVSIESFIMYALYR